MALDDPQKAFYDTRRYFQGKDDPDAPSPPARAGAGAGGGVPLVQVVAGLVFLGLIVLGFLLVGRPEPLDIPTGPAPPAAAPAPSPAAH